MLITYVLEPSTSPNVFDNKLKDTLLPPLVCSVLLIIASLFISKSHVETIYLAIIGIPKWILPIFQVALPLLIWMISEVKNRMKKT